MRRWRPSRRCRSSGKPKSVSAGPVGHGGGRHASSFARWSLPSGEYDIFVGLLERGGAPPSSPAILKRTLIVPDFWNDRLALSSLILAKAVTPLKARLPPAQQSEHPCTLGQTEVVPVAAPSFRTDEALSVATNSR